VASDWAHLPPLSDTQFEHLKRFAILTSNFAAMPERNLGERLLRATYHLGALRKGFAVTSDGSIRFKQIQESLKERFSGLSDLPQWGFVGEADAIHGGFVGLLLRQYRGNRNIVKHIPFIDLLVDSFDEFSETYRRVAYATEAPEIAIMHGPYGQPSLHIPLLRLVDRKHHRRHGHPDRRIYRPVLARLLVGAVSIAN
jgi:hypothetical protein